MMQFFVDHRRSRTTRVLGAWLCLFALILAGSSSPTAAQNVRVSLSTDSVSVGDRFHLQIAADYPDGMTAVLPDFSQGDTTLGDITVLKQVGLPQRSTNTGGRTDSVTYEITTFALDTARIPPITVGFAREGDTLQTTSEPLLVDVGSLVPDDAQDVRGLMPLAEFPGPLWPWLLGGGLALILAAALLYLFFRRSKEEESTSPERAPEVSPYAEAMTRLETLETNDLDPEESRKPFFVELSDLLRTYISRTTPVPARELTTHELIHVLERRDGRMDDIYTDRRVERIDVILRLADLVKFADRKPAPDDSMSALDATRKTIESLEQELQALKEAEAEEDAEQKEIEHQT